MIKTRGILFLAAALGVAFLGALMVSNYLNRSAPKKQTHIVAAAADIAAGETLTKEKLMMVKRPKTDSPDDALSKMELAVGRVAAGRIHKGELICEERLVSEGDFAKRPGVGGIGPGMRAVSMEIEGEAAPLEMLRAEDRVDVIATSSLPGEKHGKISRVILSDVRVLACSYSQKDQKEAIEKKGPKEGIITLLLSPEQARTLAAAEGAVLSLVMRNPLDDTREIYEATIFSVTLGPKKTSELQAMAQKKAQTLNRGIGKGKRAVTMPFKDDDGICGFIRPGNRVDILAISPEGNISVESKTPGAEAEFLKTSKTAKIILQNIEVLTVEQKVTSPAEILEKGDKKLIAQSGQKNRSPCKQNLGQGSGRLSGSKNVQGTRGLEVIGKVTLLLSPKEAEKLVAAYNSALIKLICRNQRDTEAVKTAGQKLADVFWGDREMYQVEIFRGKAEGGMSFDKETLEPVEPLPGPPLPWQEQPVGSEPL